MSKSVISKEMLTELEKIVGKDNLFKDEPMSKHTTIRVGGNADVLVRPNSIEKLQQVIAVTKNNNIPLTVIGNGSKLLVKDNGIRGVVIKLMLNLNDITFDDDMVTVSAGMSLPFLCVLCKERGLAGMEFACGIPGSVGGAVYMNAGAYGSEMANVVIETTYLDENNNICTISRAQHEFAYRQSIFKKMREDKNIRYVIVQTKIKLEHKPQAEIQAKMEENRQARIAKQPLEHPSAGSAYKRPEGYYVGKLVDDAGLKGYRINDAMVSTKHSGFIVNMGNAKAQDFISLMEHIEKVIYEKFGVKLQREIEVLGE